MLKRLGAQFEHLRHKVTSVCVGGVEHAKELDPHSSGDGNVAGYRVVQRKHTLSVH